MNCYEAIDVMEEAVEDRLPAALRPGFEEHVEECGSCRTYLEHLRFTRRALQSLPPQRGTSPRRSDLIEEFRKKFDRGGD
jgi:LSD1 subclass zinc finger protein